MCRTNLRCVGACAPAYGRVKVENAPVHTLGICIQNMPIHGIFESAITLQKARGPHFFLLHIPKEYDM